MGAVESPTSDPSRAQALRRSLQFTRVLLAEMESQPETEMLRANMENGAGLPSPARRHAGRYERVSRRLERPSHLAQTGSIEEPSRPRAV
jgi:hypothetical protein